MLKVRAVLVFFCEDSILLDDSGELPDFFLLKNDNIKDRISNFTKYYFRYPSNWLDFNLAEAKIKEDNLLLIYGVLVGKDNIKGKWINVKKLNENKERSLQEIVYSASRVV